MTMFKKPRCGLSDNDDDDGDDIFGDGLARTIPTRPAEVISVVKAFNITSVINIKYHLWLNNKFLIFYLLVLQNTWSFVIF